MKNNLKFNFLLLLLSLCLLTFSSCSKEQIDNDKDPKERIDKDQDKDENDDKGSGEDNGKDQDKDKEDDKEDPQDSDFQKIQGKWDRGDIAITISGNEATFTEIRSGNWKKVLDEGLVSIGSKKIRNIKKVSATEWSIEELWYESHNGVPQKVLWSSSGDGDIKISSDGKTVHIGSISPVDGKYSGSDYSKVQ